MRRHRSPAQAPTRTLMGDDHGNAKFFHLRPHSVGPSLQTRHEICLQPGVLKALNCIRR